MKLTASWPSWVARLRLAGLPAGVTWLAPFLCALLVWPRPLIDVDGPRFLSWVQMGGFTDLLRGIGVAAAMIVAVLVIWRGRRPWWIWTPAVALSAAVVLSGLARPLWPSVNLERDAVIIASGFPDGEVRSSPLSSVSRIEIRCGQIRRNRYGATTPALEYAVTLSGGRRLTPLAQPAVESGDDHGRTIEALEAWDRLPGLSTVPRDVRASPDCLSRLGDRIGPGRLSIVERLFSRAGAPRTASGSARP